MKLHYLLQKYKIIKHQCKDKKKQTMTAQDSEPEDFFFSPVGKDNSKELEIC